MHAFYSTMLGMEAIGGWPDKSAHSFKRKSAKRLAGRAALSALLPLGALPAAAVGHEIRTYRSENKTVVFGAPHPLLPEKDQDGTIRAITWNIKQGKGMTGEDNIPAVTEALQAQEPFMIACIQETNAQDAKRLVDALGTYTGIYDPTFVSLNPLGEQGYMKSQGNLILISSSLAHGDSIKTESRQLYQHNRDLLPRSVTVANLGHVTSQLSNLLVVNTHLEARKKSVNERQGKQVGAFVTSNSTITDSVVGCADMNADFANSTTSTFMVGDRLKAIAPGVTFGSSQRIDGFIMDTQSRVTSHAVVTNTAGISDHLMATATISTAPPIY